MRLLHLTFLFSILSLFSSDPAREYSLSSLETNEISLSDDSVLTNEAEATATNILLQSKDGGQTWQDMSQWLPEKETPLDFFAGETDVYVRGEYTMYRSKSNLTIPVWEKENVPAPGRASLVFNRSGLMAHHYEGHVYKKISATGTWQPVYTNFKKHSIRTVFETSDGMIFLGCDEGLFKSTDKGQSWKHVHNEGWVMSLVEGEGVLIATGDKGIMRSTDGGEHWEWVISEGGVGIAVERIAGGFAAISYNSTTRSRRIRISMDGGKNWKAIDERIQTAMFVLPMNGMEASGLISSIKQMGTHLVCGHPRGIYLSPDMGRTWKMVHSGVDKKVYKIYAAGPVLYAVLMAEGC